MGDVGSSGDGCRRGWSSKWTKGGGANGGHDGSWTKQTM